MAMSLTCEPPVTVEPAVQHHGEPRLPSPTRVTVTGYLVADPVLTFTATGTPVSRLQLSTRGTDGTIVVGVVVPRRLAEIAAEHLALGCHVRVEGRLRGRTWLDEDGHGCYDVEVIASAVEFLQPRAA